MFSNLHIFPSSGGARRRGRDGGSYRAGVASLDGLVQNKRYPHPL